jgi:hypothetical protein
MAKNGGAITKELNEKYAKRNHGSLTISLYVPRRTSKISVRKAGLQNRAKKIK